MSATGSMAGLVMRETMGGGNEAKPFRVESKDGIVRTYICGPTVYDSSHVGHARVYVTFDIIRRILQTHFSYTTLWQMNITDVDDKLIQRILKPCKDLKVGLREVARRYEGEFWEDMDALGVMRPDVVTRVSDYMMEIVAFIERILHNKFAYVSDGNVYFDLTEYTKQGHTHPRLLRNVNRAASVAPADAALNAVSPPTVADDKTDKKDVKGEKKSVSDFALWKAAKEGEPAWMSPWGLGRPGWHIECSAMAHAVLGAHVDLHGGGEDLCFPHHENEIAQCTAALFPTAKAALASSWVGQLMHVGHVHIAGAKMSKSLKNFVTIRDILTRFTSHQLRHLFLLHPWDSQMTFSESELSSTAVVHDKTCSEFFLNVLTHLRTNRVNAVDWCQHDQAFLLHIANCQTAVDTSFKNNLDYVSAVKSILQLISDTNKYMIRDFPQQSLIIKARNLISHHLNTVLGFNYSTTTTTTTTTAVVATVEKERNVWCAFRDGVRALAFQNKKSAGHSEIMALCDKIRDQELPACGIRIEDRRPGQSSSWKPITAASEKK